MVKTEEKSNTETVATEPVVTARASSEELPPRRPSRNRKEVSYKPLSMRAKMRRESIKMLDAVGDNVLINYSTSSKKEPMNHNNNNKNQKIQKNLKINGKHYLI